MARETDAELIARHGRVKAELERAEKSYNRCKKSGSRARKAMWAGCIRFTLLDIESEMRERGISLRTTSNGIIITEQIP